MRLSALLLVALLGAVLTPSASAQRHDVTGSVADSVGVPLPGATVVLLQRTDSSIVSFAASDAEGAFRIRRAPQGSYLIQIAFVGFATYSDSVDVADADLDLGQIQLKVEEQMLGDLVISADRTPLVLRGDTLDFSAAAFGTPAGASVEDLLRRLPGMEVDREGNVQAQGETVRRVLVDGKEFFGSDPTIATRNLPADAVDRVQVYDKQSEAAEFTGVADGNEERTINIALKPERRVGGFGKVSGAVGGSSEGGGLGDEMRYDADASINRFWGTTRLSILAGANNINGSAYGPSQFPELAALARGGAVFFGGAPNFGGGASDGFTSSASGGINLSRETGKTEFDGSYYASYKDSERDRRTLQQRILGEGQSADLDIQSDQSSDAYAHTLNLDVEHEFSDGHDVRFRSEGYYGASDGLISDARLTDSPSNDTRNERNARTTSDGDEWRGEGSLTYRRRFAGERSIVATLRGNRTDAGSLEDVTSTDRFFSRDTLLTVTEIARLEDEATVSSSASARLLATQPLPGVGRALQLDGSFSRNSNDRDRRVDDIAGGTTVLNTRLSQDFEQTIDKATVGLTYRDNGEGSREDRSFNLNVDVQTTWLQGETVGVGGPVDRRFVQVLPSLRYDQPLGTGRRVSFRYNTSTREPSVRQLQRVPDDRDPLNVYVGNPDLDPSYEHSVSANYFHFDSFAFTNLFAFVRASYTPTAISTSRIVDERFRQTTTPVNVGGEWNLSANVNHGRPIRPLGVKVQLSGSVSYRRATELLNGDENRSDLTNTSLDFRIENRRKTVLDARIGARVGYNTSAYELSPQFDRDYLTRTFYTEASIEMGKGWRAESSLDFELYPDDVFGDAQQVPLWNAQLSYDATRKVRVELSARDLLNQGLGVSYSDTGSFVQEERVSSLGRYVLLKLTYDLGAGTGASGGPPPPPGRR